MSYGNVYGLVVLLLFLAMPRAVGSDYTAGRSGGGTVKGNSSVHGGKHCMAGDQREARNDSRGSDK